MELDDLKNKWQNTVTTSTPTPKNRIMELSQQKSYGPVAELKTTINRQVYIIPFLFVVFLLQVWRLPSLQTDPFFGLFAGITGLAAVFFIAAYIILNKMGRSDAPVAEQLKRQLRYLGQMLLCYRLVSLAGVILLAFFIETFKEAGTAQLMKPWYDVHIGLRIAAYIVLLVSSYFVSRSRFYKEFGRHLAEMKKSLSETE